MFCKTVSGLGSDLLELLYPVCCLVCGDRLPDKRYLCSYCLNYAFEPADSGNHESSPGLVLPDRITMQMALWEFDKGGYLQDVLHHLKYSGLAELGLALGRELGYAVQNNRWMDVGDQTVLLPVPLHASRQRKRGYNQSALIASGIAAVTGAEPVDDKVLVRVKNTRTQTGLPAGVRRENISGAFQMNRSEPFAGRDVLIVDDVITTGATVMELSSLIENIAGRVGIATIARA